MSRKGFTLVEIMIVIVMAGLMTLIGFPKIRDSLMRAEVRGAITRISALYASARATAIQTNREATLNTNGNLVWVTVDAGGGALDTLGSVENFGLTFGVTLNAPAAINIDPRGIAAGPADYIATREEFADTVRIGNYGNIIP